MTPKTPNNNFAIAYYRYSSHAQNDLSIEQQKEQAHAYATAHGLKIIKEYEDRAISGRTDDRPGFQLMLHEIGKIRPHAVILWKTDRLGRDRYTLALAKKTIRDAGAQIHYVAETNPTDAPESVLLEGLLESMAEFYSKQLRQNVTRGMRYNAEHCLFNGHKLLGYSVDDTRHYIPDPATAPIVLKIFTEYADGRPMQDIANELNGAGIRTVLGKTFTVNSLRHILHNRAYIGEYRYSDIIVPGGMPRLISDELFDRVQVRFIQNKRTPKPKQTTATAPTDDAPRYWLTGKLFCGLCGEPLHGMSGTGKTGRRWYYYACNGKTRRKGCKLPNVKQTTIEAHVVWILMRLLSDSENLASISADIAHEYQSRDDSGAYLDSLKQQEKDAEKSINNLIRAMEAGAVSEALATRLNALETQRNALRDQIEAETIKRELTGNETTIQAFFEKFARAQLEINDIATAEQILDYFVSKIYVYPDPLRVVFEFSYDCDPLGMAYEIELDELEEITEQAFCIDDETRTIYNSIDSVKERKVHNIQECPPADADGGLLIDTKKRADSPEVPENPGVVKGSPPARSAPLDREVTNPARWGGVFVLTPGKIFFTSIIKSR